jgi:hypothetical protein
MPIKLTYEFVKEEFTKRNCILISTEYITSKTKLEFTCSCGENSEITYANFKSGGLCSKCSKENKIKKMKGTNMERYGVEFTGQRPDIKDSVKEKCSKPKKFNLEFVKNYMKIQNCELISTEYKNDRIKLEFKCICGGIAYQTFNKFYHANTKCNNIECIQSRMKKQV